MIGEKHGSHSVKYSWLGLLFLYCPAHDTAAAAEEEFIYRMEWGGKKQCFEIGPWTGRKFIIVQHRDTQGK